MEKIQDKGVGNVMICVCAAAFDEVKPEIIMLLKLLIKIDDTGVCTYVYAP